MNHLRLVTFDITETLLKFRVPPALKYAEVGAQFGVPADPNKIAENFKKQYRFMATAHPNFGLKTGLGWENWWKELVVKTFQESVETAVDKDVLDHIGAHLIELYKTSECWQTTEGTHDLLTHLTKCKIPLGIISNFDERLEPILKATAIDHYFKFVITSYKSGFSKPDSEIFQLALSELNIKPHEALHVGNTPELDYFGALKAGWNAALVHQNVETVFQKYPDINPEHVFSTLTDFHKKLQV